MRGFQNEDEVRAPLLRYMIPLLIYFSTPACPSLITGTESQTRLPLHLPCLPTSPVLSLTSLLLRLVRLVQVAFVGTKVSTTRLLLLE